MAIFSNRYHLIVYFLKTMQVGCMYKDGVSDIWEYLINLNFLVRKLLIKFKKDVSLGARSTVFLEMTSSVLQLWLNVLKEF